MTLTNPGKLERAVLEAFPDLQVNQVSGVFPVLQGEDWAMYLSRETDHGVRSEELTVAIQTGDKSAYVWNASFKPGQPVRESQYLIGGFGANSSRVPYVNALRNRVEFQGGPQLGSSQVVSVDAAVQRFVGLVEIAKKGRKRGIIRSGSYSG